jgi:hypothetical protein
MGNLHESNEPFPPFLVTPATFHLRHQVESEVLVLLLSAISCNLRDH